jgi:hypothetical protein
MQDAGGRGLRLEVVDCGHGGRDLQVNEALKRFDGLSSRGGAF